MKVKTLYLSSLIVLVSLLFYAGYTIVSQQDVKGKARRSTELVCIDINSNTAILKIHNSENVGRNYTYFITVEGSISRSYNYTVFIPGEGSFEYAIQLPRGDGGSMNFLIYKEGEVEPLENTTCYTGNRA